MYLNLVILTAKKFQQSNLWTAENIHQLCKPVHSPDVRLFLSLDNPRNTQVYDNTEQFGADEADLLVLFFWKIITVLINK